MTPALHVFVLNLDNIIKMEKSKEEFSVFMHQAVNDKKSVAHEELYQFLVSCFIKADVKLEGRVYRCVLQGVL